MSPSKQTILVTGGCGYIGSHTVLRLLESGYKVIVVDNLSNSSYESLRRVHKLYAITAAASPSAQFEDAALPVETLIPFYQVDILDRPGLVKVFENHPEISSVIHFAGRKAVGESGRIPLDYYNVNISGTVNLLQVMEDFHVRKIVFSSSATVYGNPPSIPIPETSPIVTVMSPYGRTKVFLEHILKDLCVASVTKQQQYLEDRAKNTDGTNGAEVERNYEWSVMLLRYFNPAGAHPSGIMGEDCKGTPNNLMPFLSQVAVGKLERLAVFGNDYPTEDGTCIRDYLHVVDLAQGHVAALEKLDQEQAAGNYGCKAYNLGTGTGYSVFDMVKAFSKAVGTELPYNVTDRRPGDVPNLTSDPRLANKELNWKAEKTLDEMCADLWRWQRNNPDGYAVSPSIPHPI
ncbi:UDP-glucose 4-epimerase [Linnemannia elongata AG-77]|uniref:UDP-glucose 4-epimerase n=1 Tax=Linnemannia elongata AG-77 TaxID=1314771 RepID=A0A197KAI0_9FUNG|nr:UDP-glucose 4-epimerase [Linnemannia elongata AG-77]